MLKGIEMIRLSSCCRWLISLLFACVCIPSLSIAAQESAIEYPGEPRDWHGFRLFHIDLDGIPIDIVAPNEPAPGRPWVWHGEFFGHKPEPDIRLLEAGFHCVDVELPDQLGAPVAVAKWNRVYDHLTTHFGFAQKVGLVGLSRGGLYCYHWAIANPDRVACLYGDAPVVDFRSWPGGKGTGPGSPGDWQRVLTLWQFASDEDAMAYPYIAFDHLEGLARAGVPLLHVFGDADEVVPWEENTGRVAETYTALGGSITLIRKPGVKHHPHGLDDPTPIVDFFLKHALPPEHPAALAATIVSDNFVLSERVESEWPASVLSEEGPGDVNVSPLRDGAVGSRCRVWQITSPHQAQSTWVTVFEPTLPPQATSQATFGSVIEPEANRRLPLIVLLPVEAQDTLRWGDSRRIAWAERLTESFNAVVVIPTFADVPWYGDHPEDHRRSQETFLLESLPHLIRWNCPQARLDRDGVILVGFSKSGWGAVSLLARHPNRIGQAVAFDAPLMMSEPGMYESDVVFPTPESFEGYRLTTSVNRSAETLGQANRITLIEGPNFGDDHRQFEAWLGEQNVKFQRVEVEGASHAWEAEWVRAGIDAALGH